MLFIASYHRIPFEASECLLEEKLDPNSCSTVATAVCFAALVAFAAAALRLLVNLIVIIGSCAFEFVPVYYSELGFAVAV